MEEMIEYHVDSCELFQKIMYNECDFGVKLGVRMKKGTKLLIIFGHGVCIFKQLTLQRKLG